MIDKRILRLTPKRIFCPLCGKWHDWHGKALQSYETGDDPYLYDCNGVCIQIWCNNDSIWILSDVICDKLNTWIDIGVSCLEMEYDGDAPIIKIPFTLNSYDIICKSECEDCENCDCCNFVKIGENRNNGEDEYKFDVEFKFEFASRYFNEYSKEIREKLRQNRETEKVKHQEELVKQGKVESKTTDQIKEETTMANNIFNMNVEFGPNTDKNIASTLMGVAVKNGDSWRIFDKKKKEITDVGDMQLGNLPIFILPTTKLSEGDLIKDAGEYYFVMKVESGSTQTLCAKTGEMKTVIPIKNILGFSCYSKVIALSESIITDWEFDIDKLAMMSAMYGQNGENGNQMNQLLPLMLFKDKNGGDNEMEKMLKMMLMSSMMSASANDGNPNGNINQFVPFLLLEGKGGKDNDTKKMLKMMLMSSIMGGNMAGNNNPVMSYMMLNMFMDDKKGEEAHPADECDNPQESN